MREDIVKKLREELKNLPVNTEARVVYLLVEIRKVLDHEDKRDNLLYFYCNWAVHTKLDRWPAGKIYDEICRDDMNSSHLISFNKLRGQLATFLTEHDLSDDLTKIHWESFKKTLFEILVDIPIEKKEVTSRFYFERRTGNGIEWCIRDSKGIRELGRME